MRTRLPIKDEQRHVSDQRGISAGVASPRLDLYTIGYEGRHLDEFVALLRAEGVMRVVDVRELPLSRRKGFSKRPLGEALTRARIEYVHMREAGNPYRGQKADVKRCLGLYRGHLERSPDILDLVESAAVGQRTALLCVEQDPGSCHRSVIVEHLRRRRSIAVHNL